MSAFTQLAGKVAERMRARQVREVVYFHCDHFEPWDFSQRSPDRCAEDVVKFVDSVQQVDFARRLTLFYSNPWNTRLAPGGRLLRVSPDDQIGFLPRSPTEEEAFGAPLRYLRANSGHEIQVHIHHENFTCTHGSRDDDRAEYLRGEGRRHDGMRLEFAIGQWLEAARREFSYQPRRWFFVHGLWSLNGSDPDGCTIHDEIGRLMRWGCRGDFTFPAGRTHCDPRYEAPYFCDPAIGPKSYDHRLADPQFAWGNRAAADSKFFIWSSPIKGKACSLDWGSPSAGRRLGAPEALAAEIVSRSFFWNGILFIKTHAHSMHRMNRDAGKPVPPHCYGPIRDLFGAIFEGATVAGAKVTLSTVDEIYERFVQAPAGDIVPNIGLFQPAVVGSPLPGTQTLTERLFGVAQALTKSRALPDDRTQVDQAEALSPDPTAQASWPFPRSEVWAAQILDSTVEPQCRIDHLGAGQGRLCGLLAALGMSVRGIESDAAQHELALQTAKRISRYRPDIRPFDIVLGAIPDCTAREDLSQTVAVITSLKCPAGVGPRQLLLRELHRYGMVLVELDGFLRPLGGAKARHGLIEVLQAAGFASMHDAYLSERLSFVLLVNNPRLVAFDRAPTVARPSTHSWDGRRAFETALSALAPISDTGKRSPLVELTDFVPDSGNCFRVRLPSHFPPGDSPEGRSAVALVLFQDGLPLGPAKAKHRQIRTEGGGSYSHWKHALYFSARDNSDPRTNGSRFHVFCAQDGSNRAPARLEFDSAGHLVEPQ